MANFRRRSQRQADPSLFGFNFRKVGKFLRKMGFEKGDIRYYLKMEKGFVYTIAFFGFCWWFNETSPLGWWSFKPRPKEEREMAHLYERRRFPYPGDKEAVEEFIASGGALGTTLGPKGFMDTAKESENIHKKLQHMKFNQESQKLWFRMRNEVIQEIQEKGFDIE